MRVQVDFAAGGCRRAFPRALLFAAVLTGATRPARAEPSACDGGTTLSSCFDAEALWTPTSPTPFLGLPSPRALAGGRFAVTLGTSLAHRPVTLIAPSPHPAGREVRVVENTSTLTLGARYGVGRDIDVAVAFPFVPYQNGTGIEGVTALNGETLGAPVLREPRIELGTTLLGAQPGSAVGVGTRLAATLPFGSTTEFAGFAGPTIAPGAAAWFTFGRVTLATDLGLRLRQAVTFGNVRPGSEATLAAGVAVDVLREPVRLGLALEAALRPRLASPPPAAAPDSLDLPAEWAASTSLAPSRTSPWSLVLGAGSGLPLSYTAEPGTPREPTLGVTSPSFRAALAVRFVSD